MTAIAGIWRFGGRPDSEECTRRMLTAQSMYGPHDCAQWCGGTVSLGRQLFRVLPEDRYDHGPVMTAGGHYVMAADVRLDNRDELIGLLAIPAGVACTMCDSAVLLAAFERWGEHAVDRIAGDFALALWDAVNRRLFLARDFLGSRPLHYHIGRDFIAFASMPKGLHALPEIPRVPDEEQAGDFLNGLPAGDRSFFRGIRRVETGHIVSVVPGAVSPRRYWQPARRITPASCPDDYVEGLRHCLDTAVRSRLRGVGGRVGAHLSAGFDSSAVAATAARILAPAGGRVTAFTAVPREGYDGPIPKGQIGDEGSLAALTAAMHPNIDHVRIPGGRCSPLDELDRMVFLYERPLRNICNLPWLHAINDAAHQCGLSIVLTGQMGNLGLSYNGIGHLPELFSQGHWFELIRELRAARSQGLGSWKGLIAAAILPFLPTFFRQWANRAWRSAYRDRTGYSGVKGPSGPRETVFSSHRWRDSLSLRLWSLRAVDIGTLNKGVLAGWGVDQRDPTADRRLVEYCLSVPAGQFRSAGVSRSLARRALADRLPAEVLGERRKGYQGADWHEGLTASRVNVMEEIGRLESCETAASLLDLPGLRSLMDRWPDDGWETEPVMRAYRVTLLRGISVGHFLSSIASSRADGRSLSSRDNPHLYPA